MRFSKLSTEHSCRIVVLCGSLLIAWGCGGGATAPGPEPPGTLPLERYDVGFFSINKPRGWTVTIAGRCGELAFLIRDPGNPLRQIFYFGSVGPIYMSQAQKNCDSIYVSQGGYPIPWMDAPVVDPFTPANFLAHWPGIAHMAAATAFLSDFPELSDLALIANAPQTAMLPNGTTGNARGLFTRNGSVGEGMFLVTVVPFMPYAGVPGGGNGNGHFVCGVSAPKAEFPAIAARLIESLESFTITQSYVDGCLAQQAKIWGAVAAAGRTLSEASDIIWEGWEARTHTEDISAEQWTDAYRGVERVYDPGTGEVYEMPAGWYADYDLHRGEYDMGGLQPLPPGAWDLWMAAVLDGAGRIH
jgi:hypothetical protein